MVKLKEQALKVWNMINGKDKNLDGKVWNIVSGKDKNLDGKVDIKDAMLAAQQKAKKKQEK